MVPIAEDLKWTLMFSSNLGLLTPTEDKRLNLQRKIIKFAFTITLLITMCYWAVLSAFINKKEEVLIHMIFIISIGCANISLTLNDAASKFRKLLQLLDKVDSMISIEMNQFHQRHAVSSLNLRFLCLHGIMVLFIPRFIYAIAIQAEYFAALELGYFYGTYSSIQTYYNAIGFFLEYAVIKTITVRFTALNEQIRNLNLLTPTSSMITKKDRLIRIGLAHNYLCDALETFNDIFGWHIFLIISSNAMNVVQMIIFFLQGGNITEQMLQIVYVFGYCASGVAVAAKCEELVREGKKTIIVAYGAINQHSQNCTLREYLLVLAQQATSRCPHITAARFFTVDFAMLFMFINLVSSYMMVVIQFSIETGN